MRPLVKSESAVKAYKASKWSILSSGSLAAKT